MASLNTCIMACLTFWKLFSESFKLESRKADFFSVTKWVVHLETCWMPPSLFPAPLACMTWRRRGWGGCSLHVLLFSVAPLRAWKHLEEASGLAVPRGPTAARGRLASRCSSPSILGLRCVAWRQHIGNPHRLPFSVQVPAGVTHTGSLSTGMAPQWPWTPLQTKEVQRTQRDSLQGRVALAGNIGALRK